MKTISILFSLFFILTISSYSQNLKVGDNAPDFTLQDAYGNSFTLSDYEGKNPVIVYFYPKANTSGCTTQACGIRDNWRKFKDNEIPVFGISVDPKENIKKFIDDYNLNFPLLSDIDKNVSKKYGVLSEGGYAKRYTFIIDKNGKIADIIKVENIEAHADKVFNIAMELK